MKLRCGLLLAVLAAATALAPLEAAPRPTGSVTPASVTPEASGSVALSVRRSSEGVELVIEGTGAAPVLQQSRDGQAWRGDLQMAAPGSLRLGPQRFTLPEAGLQSVSLNGAGRDYQLQVVPMPGAPLSRPVVSADGRNLIISFSTPVQSAEQSARFNLREPGSVPQPAYAPPLKPRAVAPPLGDMAVGTMVLSNRSFLKLNGPPVTMTLRNAPSKDALMALAQLGGYGFVYVADDSSAPSTSRLGQQSPASGQDALVSLAFRGESYSRAVNSVLLAAGLQGRLEGRMLMVGPSVLGKTFGAQLSRFIA